MKSPKKENIEELIFLKLNELTELRDVYLEFLEFYILETSEINDYLLIEFFESLYPLIFTKEDTTYFEVQFDHMKFFVLEIIIYTIALLYKYKKYKEIKELISNSYVVRNHHNNELIGSIGMFRFTTSLISSVILPSSQQKYISNVGQLLIERASFKNISSKDLIEADYLIYLLTYIFDKQDYRWYPPTIPYFSIDKITFLSKLKSRKFYENCKLIFGDLDLGELKVKFAEFNIALNKRISSSPMWYIDNLSYDPEEIAKY